MDGEFGGFWWTMIVLISVVGTSGALVAIILGVVVWPTMFKERTKRSAHDLVAKAIDRGESIDPELMKKLSETIEVRQRPARKTLGNAIWLLALAAAFISVSLLNDGALTDGDFLAVPALVLAALGVAFLVMAAVDYQAEKKKKEA